MHMPERGSIRGLIFALLTVFLLSGWVAGHAHATASGSAGMLDEELAERLLHKAEGMPRLHALIVARHGEPLIERSFRGPGLDMPVNVKSVAKTIISALVGAAVDRGLIDNTEVPAVSLLDGMVPDGADPKLAEITLGHLLSMQAGLERTSGANYGRWVLSGDWVAFVLTRPFVDRPGGRMLYSTGNSHLVSALLTQVSGRSTLALAREWLAAPLGFDLPAWDRDPQGIYFGGNNMLLSPRALLRFGEMYRNGGVFEGRRVLSEEWIRASWTPYTASFFSEDDYGYGWFIAEMCEQPVYYARGFGGQFLYVVPSLALSVVMTSEDETRTHVDGYYNALRKLVSEGIIPAALHADVAAGKSTGRGKACL